MISRRDWFHTAGLSTLAVLDPTPSRRRLLAEEKAADALTPLNRFPRAEQEWYVGRVREIEKESTKTQGFLRFKEDAEAFIRKVKNKIRLCFGPFPEKTPLNAKVTGIVERDAYVIEKVIFESRPGFLVTANLYLPKGAKGPRPGVVGSCGHSTIC